MQSFYRQLQGSTCNGQQTQTEKEETLQKLRKEEQRAKCFDWEEISEISEEQEKEEHGKRASALSRNVDFGWRK